jgi:hypothetical protein
MMQSSAPNFQVEGEFGYELNEPGNQQPNVHRKRFVAIVREYDWFIRTYPIGRSDFAYSQIICDGTNLYSCTKRSDTFDGTTGLQRRLAAVESLLRESKTNGPDWRKLTEDKNSIERSLLRSKTNAPKSVNDSVGIVVAGLVPQFDGDMIAPLWFAFASRHYLRGRSKSLLPVVWQPSGDALARSPEETPGTVTWSEREPRLPVHAKFYYQPANRETRDDIAAEYSAEEFRTINGLALPSRFVFSVFSAPSTAPRGTGTPVLFRISGSVSNANVVEGISFPTNTSRMIYVSDRRFAQAGMLSSGVSYVSNTFLSTSEIGTLTNYHRQALVDAKQKQLTRANKQRFWLVAFALFGVALLPVIIAIRHNRCSHFNKSTPKT